MADHSKTLHSMLQLLLRLFPVIRHAPTLQNHALQKVHANASEVKGETRDHKCFVLMLQVRKNNRLTFISVMYDTREQRNFHLAPYQDCCQRIA